MVTRLNVDLIIRRIHKIRSTKNAAIQVAFLTDGRKDNSGNIVPSRPELV